MPRSRLGKWLAVVAVVVGVTAAVIWGLALAFSATPARGEPYQLVSDWPQLPAGLALGQVSGVGVDSAGQVYVFRRADRVWQGGALYVGEVSMGMRVQKFAPSD